MADDQKTETQAVERTYTADEVRELMRSAWIVGDHQHFNARPDRDGDVERLLTAYELRHGR